MRKVHTTTEAMESILLVVDNVERNISIESKKILNIVDSVHRNANAEIRKSDSMIQEWQDEIVEIEHRIDELNSYNDESGDDDSSYELIEEYYRQISDIESKIRREKNRNDKLRQMMSRFRIQSSETLKSVKKINLATNSANTEGKNFVKEKIKIISDEYGSNVVGSSYYSGIVNESGESEEAVDANDGYNNINSSVEADNYHTNVSGDGDYEILSFGNDMLEAQNWGKRSFNNWKNSLSFVEKQALIDYKQELNPHEASYYVNINNTLRGNDYFRDGNQVRNIRIHDALGRAQVPDDVMVYRAISQERYNDMRNGINSLGGNLLVDNGYMSCSLVSDNLFTRSKNVILRLTVPQGTHGAFIADVGSEYMMECELLLDRGSAVFVTNTVQAPRSVITGNASDTDMITIVDGVIEQ